MTLLLDWSEHELRSIRSWLNDLFPERDIWITRPTAQFSRPALRVTETTNRRTIDQGRVLQMDEANWQIEVLNGQEGAPVTNDLWSTKRDLALIKDKLLRSKLVPLYLWGWPYLQPQAKGVEGAGSLDGEASIRVSAVNVEGEESLASDPEVVTVPAGSAIELLIPPWPREAKVAEEYRVYAGASGAEQFQIAVAPDEGPVPTKVILGDFAVGTDSPPDSSKFFSQRFMRVREVETRMLEHPDINGLFNGFVELRTWTQLVRDPVNIWPDAVREIETTVEMS